MRPGFALCKQLMFDHVQTSHNTESIAESESDDSSEDNVSDDEDVTISSDDEADPPAAIAPDAEVRC